MELQSAERLDKSRLLAQLSGVDGRGELKMFLIAAPITLATRRLTRVSGTDAMRDRAPLLVSPPTKGADNEPYTGRVADHR